MGLLTTYVCDCCGAQSSDLQKFTTVPVAFAVGQFACTITGCLICTVCESGLSSAINSEYTSLAGKKTGVQL